MQETLENITSGFTSGQKKKKKDKNCDTLK